jgi:hypothetical protein
VTGEYVNVAQILSGDYKAPQTAVGGVRDDGMFLLYPAAVNGLLGAPEVGKTLIAAGMCADELFRGGSVLWLDLDHNGPVATISRFRSFGVSAVDLADESRFRLAVPSDADEVLEIVKDRWNPSVVVIDSVGELLPMFGASSNDADDYTRVNRQVATEFAGAGAAVLLIDHEAKGTDSRAYGATGTVAKKRAVDGALYRASIVAPFAPGRGGEAALAIVKDRHGHVRANSPTGQREPIAARFILTPAEIGVGFSFKRPTTQMPREDDVALLLAMAPVPASVRDVKERMKWGTTRASEAWRAFQSVPGTFPGVPENRERKCSPVPLPFRGGTGNTLEEQIA